MTTYLAIIQLPLIILMLVTEIVVGRRRGKPYSLHSTLSNLSCGLGKGITYLTYRGVGIAGYAWVSRHAALHHFSPRSVLAWLLVFPAADLCYYWYHRAGHRVNLLWAGHAVHHQGEELNVSAGVRQSWFVGALGWMFYLPLAVAGFPYQMYVAVALIDVLYQYSIHTRLIGRLGPLEWILTTPSHHRVHHGANPEYLDANYGGFFIVWDRLFGTFRPERDEPVYGTVKPLADFDPLWANLVEWQRLVQMTRATRRLRDKVRVWFAPPEWRPADLGGPVVAPTLDRTSRAPHAVVTARGTDAYVITQFVATALVFGVHSSLLHALTGVGGVIGAFVVASVVSIGGVIESRRWAVPLEYARLLYAVVAMAVFSRSVLATGAVGAVAGASAVWFGVLVARARAAERASVPVYVSPAVDAARAA